MRLILLSVLLVTPALPIEIPASVEVTSPHHVAPGEEFSITFDIAPGSEGKTDYKISEINITLPPAVSGPEEISYDESKEVPFDESGFAVENEGVFLLEGTVETNRGQLPFASEPILCMRNWPTGPGVYYAAGIEETLGKSLKDSKASLGIARRFGPEGNVYNKVVIWGPTVEFEPGPHSVTFEMRAEGGPNAYNFVAEAQITGPGEREEEVEIIASRIITGAVFPDDEEYYATSIDFNTYAETETLQVRLIYYGYAILYVDRIVVE